jgi:uncharacterized cupin superfamily protein
MDEMSVVRSSDRDGWTTLVDPPGEIPSGGRERTAFTSGDGSFTFGLWEREPDTWSFERPYDEVAMVLSGRADIETADGRMLSLGPGAILVTPVGSKGTWTIHETLLKCFAIYEGGPAGETKVRVFRTDESRDWTEIERPAGDENPPGEEWVAFRSGDQRFSVGLWHRAPETGRMDLTYHEVACLTEGEVDVQTDDGRLLSIGPGDVLVTPKGTGGLWKAKSRVEKLWAVHHE